MMENQMNKNESILYFLDYGKVFGGAVHTLIQQALLMKKAGYKVFLFFSDNFVVVEGQSRITRYEREK